VAVLPTQGQLLVRQQWPRVAMPSLPQVLPQGQRPPPLVAVLQMQGQPPRRQQVPLVATRVNHPQQPVQPQGQRQRQLVAGTCDSLDLCMWEHGLVPSLSPSLHSMLFRISARTCGLVLALSRKLMAPYV
jgi:hypothetical protein